MTRWWRTIGIAVCLIVLAIDVSAVPAFSAWWWRIFYPAAAVALIVWRLSHDPRFLALFGLTLGTASTVRSLLLAATGTRWSGAAINALLAIMAFESMRLAAYVKEDTTWPN
jgi:hypothetical protein